MRSSHLGFLAIFCVLFLSSGCGFYLGDIRAQSSEPDYWPTEGWRTSLPEYQGMSSAHLLELHNYIQAEDLPLDSVLVIRHGYIVHEEYPHSYDADDYHILHSVTKSFTSALVGIAVSQGHIGSVQDTVLSFFTDRTIENRDAWKEAMTIEHLLNMMAGLEWDEWTYPYEDSRNSVLQMIYSLDNVQYMLDLPMVAQPGTTWVYNTGASHLLAAIVYEATGQTPLEYALAELFGPLGFGRVFWIDDPQGINYGGHNLHVRPRDMAKFGFLYLHNGRWDGQQILPATWVTRSRQSAATPWTTTGYGFQWWKNLDLGTFEARGRFNQWIIVHPDEDLVVVFTATDLDGEINIFYLVEEFILGAIEEFTGLPGSPWLIPMALIIGIGVPVTIVSVYFLRRRSTA